MKTIAEIAEVISRGTLEDAVLAYKTARLAIKEYEEVAKAALSVAERIATDAGITHVRTVAGTAGWTRPKTYRKLDVKALEAEAERNDDLRQLVERFYVTRSQQPRFFIR